MNKIGLIGVQWNPAHMRLFRWLEEALIVQFVAVPNPDESACVDGWFGVGAEGETALSSKGLRSPGMLYSAATTSPKASLRRIHFSDAADTPYIFRGRQIEQLLSYDSVLLDEAMLDHVIARADGRPAWGRKSDEYHSVEKVGFSLPEPKAGETLGDLFNQFNYARLLPLVDFLKRITRGCDWKESDNLACFMFDDPNLHGDRYGFIDYQKLAQDAVKHTYHVAFATVPLDAWYVSAHVASLFAESQSQLSLLIHGNDHSRNELAGLEDPPGRLASLAQAIRRIEGLEKTAGFRVARVMAPPHGACSEDSMRDMARLGFTGMSVSHSSLRFWNKAAPWTGALGLRRSEVIEGLPVVPRFRIRQDCQPAILLAAYLGQPIIPVGHHQDVRGGVELLTHLAQFINTIPNIRWANMETVFETNYRIKAGPVNELHVGSRRIQLSVPAGVKSLRVGTTWQRLTSAEFIDILSARFAQRFDCTGMTDPFPVQEGDILSVSVAPRNAVSPASVPNPRLRIWPFFRRQLSECRDRLGPLGAVLRGQSKKIVSR